MEGISYRAINWEHKGIVLKGEASDALDCVK
jgi:hypothetical protein